MNLQTLATKTILKFNINYNNMPNDIQENIINVALYEHQEKMKTMLTNIKILTFWANKFKKLIKHFKEEYNLGLGTTVYGLTLSLAPTITIKFNEINKKLFAKLFKTDDIIDKINEADRVGKFMHYFIRIDCEDSDILSVCEYTYD
jgi:hypothetical protein